MQIVLLLIAIIILLFILVKSAGLVEEAFVFLSRKVKISEFFIGFVVLAIITSLPEMSIAILASQDVPELSVGNLIGASTVLLTLVIGLAAIKYSKLQFKGKFSEKEVILGLLIISAMIAVMLDSIISVAEGIILIGGYTAYILYLNRKFNKNILDKHSTINLKKISNLLVKASIGVFLLLVSSSLLVKSATDLAHVLDITPSLVGLMILAIGTNLPEITILAISKKNREDESLALGSFFGSAVVNPGIMGLLAILSGGIQITSIVSLVPSLVILVLTIILFTVASWTGKKITSFEGLMLISLYIALLISEFLIILQ